MEVSMDEIKDSDDAGKGSAKRQFGGREEILLILMQLCSIPLGTGGSGEQIIELSVYNGYEGHHGPWLKRCL
ncbi:hypothetical protein GUJ93_ZPchr0013g34665 [Zizania palustris]|uniref:Uncharacterized protein n=1 Tax=Zizania palustris TaxID=103762 RepID=A0A8J6C0H1_ZIZPA|nr:hypothetical protein GUJ93_ZPchr0013g34665 [Zizania palustris]